MSQLIHRSHFKWSLIILIPLALLAGLLLTRPGEAAPETPASPPGLPYSHQVHVQKVGIQCLFCHSDALRAPQAGLPSLQKCMVCHDYVTVDNPAGQQQVEQLKQAFAEGQRVQWPDVYKQPDYVYFSHRPHLAKGVACETCHGDVQNMQLAEKQVEMDMGFCLKCHRQQPPELQPRLLDCATCHK